MTAHARFARRLVLPIRLGIDPMERLLVASLKGDPEFEALEPQVFDDEGNGHGMRVLRYPTTRRRVWLCKEVVGGPLGPNTMVSGQ